MDSIERTSNSMGDDFLEICKNIDQTNFNLKTTVEKYKNDLVVSMSKIQELIGEKIKAMTQLECVREKMNSDRARIVKENESLKSQIHDSRTDNLIVTQKLQTTIKALETLQTEMKALKEENNSAKTKLQVALSEKYELADKWETAEKDRNECARELETVKNENEKFESKLKVLIKDRDDLSSKLEDQTAKFHDVNSKLCDSREKWRNMCKFIMSEQDILTDGTGTSVSKSSDLIEHSALPCVKEVFNTAGENKIQNNNWVPRRDENNPKTVDQIRKEAEREDREQQLNLQNMSFNKRINDDREMKGSTTRNMGTSEDGWTLSTKSNKGSYGLVDPNKLKLTKPDEVESIRLGPGRARQIWGRYSSGTTKAAAGSYDPEKTALQYRYSFLAKQTPNSSYIENRRESQRKTPSTSKERDNAIEAVKGLVRGGPITETKTVEANNTAETQLNGKAVESTELSLKGAELNDEQMDKKTKPLIDEFLHNNDFEKATRCVTELASPSTVQMFINSAINQVLKRSSQARHALGQLLFSLVRQNIISSDQYKKGFSNVLEFAHELALEVPLIWEYIGEILDPLFEDNKFSLTFLKEVLEQCLPSAAAGLLVSATLHSAAKKMGTIKLGELWRESNLQWTDFIGDEANINEFIQKHKLEFTISPTKLKPLSIPLLFDEMKKHLLELFEKTKESEEIFNWIGANIPDNTEPTFIRALVSAVHENAIKVKNSELQLDTPLLKKRITILTRYIDHNADLELQALFALQALMNELNHPRGILRYIFDVIYDDDVITEESFKNWEQSEDPNENKGKAFALHSVESFLTWLKESESGDSVPDTFN